MIIRTETIVPEAGWITVFEAVGGGLMACGAGAAHADMKSVKNKVHPDLRDGRIFLAMFRLSIKIVKYNRHITRGTCRRGQQVALPRWTAHVS